MKIYGSVGAGIEAATVACNPLGWRASWFAEIEKYPSRVLACRWADVPNLGDMTLIADRILAGDVPAPDVLVGGTPCQSYSISGTGGGLNDDRGKLTLEYAKILDSIDTVRTARGERPCIAVWENVPNILSRKHAEAFGWFLSLLVGGSRPLQAPAGRWPSAGVVAGPKRAAVWRCLNSKYFGLAQSRNRVFLVAGAGAPVEKLAEVLIESKSPDRSKTPVGEEEQQVAEGVRGRVGVSTPELRRPRPAGGEPLTYDLRGNGDGHHTTCLTGDHTNRASDYTPIIIQPVRSQASTGEAIVGTLMAQAHGQCAAINTGMQHSHVTAQAADYKSSDALYIVRRPTPLEAERLMGLPDNYTNLPGAADTPRYKAIGNSFAVPVMRWIAERIECKLGAHGMVFALLVTYIILKLVLRGLFLPW